MQLSLFVCHANDNAVCNRQIYNMTALLTCEQGSQKRSQCSPFFQQKWTISSTIMSVCVVD